MFKVGDKVRLKSTEPRLLQEQALEATGTGVLTVRRYDERSKVVLFEEECPGYYPSRLELVYTELKYNPTQMVDDEEDI